MTEVTEKSLLIVCDQIVWQIVIEKTEVKVFKSEKNCFLIPGEKVLNIPQV